MKLEINYRKKSRKAPKAWRLKNTQLKNEWVNQAIRQEIKKYMETSENENARIQMLWNAAKAVLRGKYIAIQAYLKKQEKIPNTKSKSTLKGTRSRKGQRNSKAIRRRENKDYSRNEQYGIQKNKTKQNKNSRQINETKSWLF